MDVVRIVTALSGQEGGQVALAGIAEDTGAGAVVRLDRPEARIGVAGLGQWPDDLGGDGVVVRGRLVRVADSVDEQRGVAPWVVEDATWEPMPGVGGVVTTWEGLPELAGGDVRLRGQALDAHAGAIVVLLGGPVYVDGVRWWPEEVSERTVEVTGVLVPPTNDDAWRIAQPTWTVVEPG